MKMRLAVLSRNRNLYSTQRLHQEAKKEKIHCDFIDPLRCQLIIDGKESRILENNRILPHYDAVLPRIGTSITEYGLAVVKHFEIQGTRIINHSEAIANSRDKMLCLQILTQAKLLTPATVLTRSPRSLKSAVESVKGLPVVLKVLQGTQGIGVMLVNSPISVGSVLDTLRTLNQDILIQQFIKEANGKDFRAFVVGKKVIATMMRTAPHGEFRSNMHRGAKGQIIKLSNAHEKLAVRATRILGLEIAGVDLMESNYGPMIIEVNSSPGFEGIEKATRINVARQIIQYAKKIVKQNSAPPRRFKG